MINSKIARIFYNISDYYAMADVAFKPAAYLRAARLIEGLSDDLAETYKIGGVKALMEVEGVGRGLAEKIEEYIKTGRIEEYEKLKKQTPVDLESLTKIEGLGPKTIKKIYEELGVKTLADLEKMARAEKIRKLPRMGARIEQKILRGLEYAKGSQGRFLLGDVWPLAKRIEERLKNLHYVKVAVAAGSIRRRRETVGDIDILAISDKPEKAMDFFCSMKEVEEILAQGQTKSSVRLDIGINADIRVLPKESFGAALQYFTGNKDHNIILRKIAQGKGLKLNEYGLFKGKKQVAGATEKNIYAVLGLKYIEPEMRENTGEIEASLQNKLPRLIECKDIKGDLQMHSVWSDGENSIREMAEAAKKLGREYIAITDHAGVLKIANAMGKKEILAQWREIDKLNKSIPGIKILKGAEVDLDENGRPQLEEELLAGFDLVLGAAHSKMRLARSDATARFVNALANPYVDIIAHPTGRIIQRREEMELDLDAVFAAAKKNNKIMEIDAYPDRLDLKDINIKRAIAIGVKLSISTDSHSAAHLPYLEFGVWQARRGWAEKGDIINTMSYEQLMKFLKKK